MIVKKIPRLTQAQGFEHAHHVRNLVDYMRLPDKGSPYAEALVRYLQEEGIKGAGVERLLHVGARNFLSRTLEGQRAEMMASASRAVRSPNPLAHWLISWKEHERPSLEQIDEAVDMFVTHLGLGGHQAIYAAHSDTHNVHVHIAVNRYDPVRQRMLKVNKGFDREAAHEAICLIVERQGWQQEENARYELVDGKPQLAHAAATAMAEGRKALSSVAAAFESRTGLKSAQRIAIEEAGPIMRRSRTWAELHFDLAEIGIRYVPKGSGAVLQIGEEYVTASSAHRSCAHAKMQEQLGGFKTMRADIELRPRTLEQNLMPNALRADEYHQERRRLRDSRTHAQLEVRVKRDKAQHEARKRHERDIDLLNGLQDGGQSLEREALRSIIDERKQNAIENADREAKEELSRISARHKLGSDYEEWLRSIGEEYFAERWRRRWRLKGWVCRFEGVTQSQAAPKTIDGYHPSPIRGGMRWAREGEDTAFVEWPDGIEVAKRNDDEAILAAFRLAVVKYGRMKITGPAPFQERAVAIIRKNGLGDRIANVEWQQRAQPATWSQIAEPVPRLLHMPPEEGLAAKPERSDETNEPDLQSQSRALQQQRGEGR
jgi:hypothetical protein